MAGPSEKELEAMHRPSRTEAFLRWLLPLLGLYLDDLLMTAAGICFTASAATAFGCSAALAVAGVCLLGYGVLVGRARNRR